MNSRCSERSGKPTPNPSQEGNLRAGAATTFEHCPPRPNAAGQFPSWEGLGVGFPGGSVEGTVMPPMFPCPAETPRVRFPQLCSILRACLD